MPMPAKALIWAALIIAFAILANGQGWDDELSLLIVIGVGAIAVVHLYRGRNRCLQGR